MGTRARSYAVLVRVRLPCLFLSRCVQDMRLTVANIHPQRGSVHSAPVSNRRRVPTRLGSRHATCIAPSRQRRGTFATPSWHLHDTFMTPS